MAGPELNIDDDDLPWCDEDDNETNSIWFYQLFGEPLWRHAALIGVATFLTLTFWILRRRSSAEKADTITEPRFIEVHGEVEERIYAGHVFAAKNTDYGRLEDEPSMKRSSSGGRIQDPIVNGYEKIAETRTRRRKTPIANGDEEQTTAAPSTAAPSTVARSKRDLEESDPVETTEQQLSNTEQQSEFMDWCSNTADDILQSSAITQQPHDIAQHPRTIAQSQPQQYGGYQLQSSLVFEQQPTAMENKVSRLTLRPVAEQVTEEMPMTLGSQETALAGQRPITVAESTATVQENGTLQYLQQLHVKLNGNVSNGGAQTVTAYAAQASPDSAQYQMTQSPMEYLEQLQKKLSEPALDTASYYGSNTAKLDAHFSITGLGSQQQQQKQQQFQPTGFAPQQQFYSHQSQAAQQHRRLDPPDLLSPAAAVEDALAKAEHEVVRKLTDVQQLVQRHHSPGSMQHSPQPQQLQEFSHDLYVNTMPSLQGSSDQQQPSFLAQISPKRAAIDEVIKRQLAEKLKEVTAPLNQALLARRASVKSNEDRDLAAKKVVVQRGVELAIMDAANALEAAEPYEPQFSVPPPNPHYDEDHLEPSFVKQFQKQQLLQQQQQKPSKGPVVSKKLDQQQYSAAIARPGISDHHHQQPPASAVFALARTPSGSWAGVGPENLRPQDLQGLEIVTEAEKYLAEAQQHSHLSPLKSPKAGKGSAAAMEIKSDVVQSLHDVTQPLTAALQKTTAKTFYAAQPSPLTHSGHSAPSHEQQHSNGNAAPFIVNVNHSHIQVHLAQHATASLTDDNALMYDSMNGASKHQQQPPPVKPRKPQKPHIEHLPSPHDQSAPKSPRHHRSPASKKSPNNDNEHWKTSGSIHDRGAPEASDAVDTLAAKVVEEIESQNQFLKTGDDRADTEPPDDDYEQEFEDDENDFEMPEEAALIDDLARTAHTANYNNEQQPQQEYAGAFQVRGKSATESERSAKLLRHQSSVLDVVGVDDAAAAVRSVKTLNEVSSIMRRAGLEKSSLIFGIDYTASNKYQGEESFGRRSLHSINVDVLNPYQQVISILGKTLAPFATSGYIPAFGFGDITTTDISVFPLKSGRFCGTFEELLRVYNAITPNVILSGPTNFAPLIYESINICRQTREYHILVIVADGQVTNERATRRAIVEACQYPLSIIVVGVGDGPWDMMRVYIGARQLSPRVFDESLPRRPWDNFHFIEFRQVMKCTENSDVNFAVQSLMEIPDQYKTIKAMGLLNFRED